RRSRAPIWRRARFARKRSRESQGSRRRRGRARGAQGSWFFLHVQPVHELRGAYLTIGRCECPAVRGSRTGCAGQAGPVSFRPVQARRDEAVMPFKSQAQRRKFAELLVQGKISPETFEEWNRETGSAKLPERVAVKKGARKKPRTKGAAR